MNATKKWVTWEQVGVDRMASAWLIRRYVDAAAEFIFVPVGHQPLPEGAEPFDLPGVRLSHHRGHCTFHTMLREFGLTDPVLHRIARIVDEADVIQDINIEATAPGLDFICRGIRRTSPDDYTALERGGFIFDALYAELAREVADPSDIGGAI